MTHSCECPACGHNLLYQSNEKGKETKRPDGTFDLDCGKCGVRLHQEQDGKMAMQEKA